MDPDPNDVRWATVLDLLSRALPADARLIRVTGPAGRAALLAERLRAVTGVPASAVDDEPPAEAAFVVGVRARSSSGDHARDRAGAWAEKADAVVDLHDPDWPVLRHVDPRLLPGDFWYRGESQAFFAARAGSWDTKFGDDLPAYTAAVTAAGLTPGATAADIGCGTGRALPVLRDAVGPSGHVLGLDLTPEMLTVARERAHACRAQLVLADARHLPLATASVDAVLAAGLVNHLPHPPAGLKELARVTRPGGTLILFHPTGRRALAARHGRVVRPDEPLSEAPLAEHTRATGWTLTTYDDAPHRFLALATRR